MEVKDGIVYLVTDWDEMSGPFGSILGVYSEVELIYVAVTTYLESVLLFTESNEPLTTEDLETMLSAADPMLSPIVVVKDGNDGRSAMIYKCEINRSKIIWPFPDQD